MRSVIHAASVLWMTGEGLLEFIDGLSSNLVDGPCTTVFMTPKAKIVDVVDVVPKDNGVALIGWGRNKESLLNLLTERSIGRLVNILDVSHLNQVLLSIDQPSDEAGVTIHKSFFGWMRIASVSQSMEPSWTLEEWTEYRIGAVLPYFDHEINDRYHPLACGLGALVHEQKGCYVGQELMARMRSRGRQGHQLVAHNVVVEGATTAGQTGSLSIQRTQ